MSVQGMFAGAIVKINAAASGSRSRVKGWQQDLAQSKLERRLARIIETSDGHKAKGVPRNDEVYLTLAQEARDRIEKFSARFNVPVRKIEAQAPALRDLYAMARPAVASSPATRMFLAVLAGGCLLLVIGVASGIIQVGHAAVIQAAHHLHFLAL